MQHLHWGYAEVVNLASSVPNELSHAVVVPANCCMWKDAKAAQKVLSVK